MADNTTEWCAGLPLVQQRLFTSEEQEYLQRLAYWLRRRGIWAILAYPMLIAVFGVAEWATSASAVQGLGGMLIGGVVLLVVYGPFLPYIVRDTIGRSKDLTADLRCGFVKQFAGMMSADVGMDPTIVKLRQARIVPKTGTGQWQLEMLPTSKRVWRVQEQRVKPWIVARVVEVAQTPEIAAIAAQWIQPFAQKAGETLLGGRRELSPSERDELRRYARHAWTRLLPSTIIFTLWAWGRIHSLIVHGDGLSGVNWVFFAVFLFFTLCVDLVFVAQLLLARKLRQDAQAGQVIIVKVEQNASVQGNVSVEENVQPVTTEAPAETTPMIREILPNAKREWTLAGRPATWRTIRS